jgi:hypothetical protein
MDQEFLKFLIFVLMGFVISQRKQLAYEIQVILGLIYYM